jgi:hypothetical protein
LGGYTLLLVPGFMFGYVLSRPLAVHFEHGQPGILFWVYLLPHQSV